MKIFAKSSLNSLKNHIFISFFQNIAKNIQKITAAPAAFFIGKGGKFI